MRVLLIKSTKIEVFELPQKIYGDYWITDADINGMKRNLLNVKALNNEWVMYSNSGARIKYNNQEFQEIVLKKDSFFDVDLTADNNRIKIYCEDSFNKTYDRYYFKDDVKLSIGQSNKCDICVEENNNIKGYFEIIKNGNVWNILKYEMCNDVYINNSIFEEPFIINGSKLFYNGLNIVFLGEYLLINKPSNLSKMIGQLPVGLGANVDRKNMQPLDEKEVSNPQVYFIKMPRVVNFVEPQTIEIEAPPEEKAKDEQPMIYTIGPALTMGASSVVMLMMTLNNISTGQATLSSSISSIVMSGALLVSMLVWPVLRKKYERRKIKKDNRLRIKRYKEYLDKKQNQINEAISLERSTLKNNFPSALECAIMVVNGKNNYWKKGINEDDFLTFRLGLGVKKPDFEVDYPKEKFRMKDDDLLDEVKRIENSNQVIDDVPIVHNFCANRFTSILGEVTTSNIFLKNILMQLLFYYNYDEVKIVVLTSEDRKNIWSPIRNSKYNWDNNNELRFFATSNDDAQQINSYFENILKLRENNFDYKKTNCYYLVFIDDYVTYRNLSFLNKLLNSESNLGFSVISLAKSMNQVPSQSDYFIMVNSTIQSNIFGREVSVTSRKEFQAELFGEINLDNITHVLSNIAIESISSNHLPDSISFLEMFDVGKVEQLNALKRWNDNNPVSSIQAAVGRAESGELLKLDAHEKFHGPHGLIAGMTGSGKSEFIITYLLSLAVNYHPHEVSFVLIDYKGGGLVGAFLNKETKVVLPHVAGTVTNLDNSILNRVIISIESELKRRQAEFNKARDILNVGNIDIYKYQRLYREGKLEKPISHLFIVCDEFAELKTQKPEFMEQLISTARIGRSLGVHLILATQKPSGVVNDQIWSNSKFRVCLKVQDANDSKDMIKTQDAAGIVNVGRFILQVGYNELYLTGQSAWGGNPYYDIEKITKEVNTDVELIDNIGFAFKKTNFPVKNPLVKKGDEATAIVKYLYNLSRENNMFASQLWVDILEGKILFPDLLKKYNYQKQAGLIEAIIGEYDDPVNQTHHLFKVAVGKNGNMGLYGIADSGKEQFLLSFIFSLITFYTTDEINIYIIDGGSSILKNFANMPQVGNYISIDQKENIFKLIEFIETLIKERKKLFSKYGSYEEYCKNENKVPVACVVINNFDTINEVHRDLSDLLVPILRDCTKYGIYFMVSVNTINGIPYRLKNYISDVYTTQFSDFTDQKALLGVYKLPEPTKIKGRGLFKALGTENVYEYQSALICEYENLGKFLENVTINLNKTLTKKAVGAKTMPDIITREMLKDNLKSLKQIPIGINISNISVKSYNFDEKNVNVIVTNKFSENQFIKALLLEIEEVKDSVFILDDTNSYKVTDFKKSTYCNKNLEELLIDLTKIKDKDKFCIIIGFSKLVQRLEIKDIEKLFSNGLKYLIIDEDVGLYKHKEKSWFYENVKFEDCIWMGPNIRDAKCLRLSISNNLNSKISNEYGYIVKENDYELIKLVGEADEE